MGALGIMGETFPVTNVSVTVITVTVITVTVVGNWGILTKPTKTFKLCGKLLDQPVTKFTDALSE